MTKELSICTRGEVRKFVWALNSASGSARASLKETWCITYNVTWALNSARFGCWCERQTAIVNATYGWEEKKNKPSNRQITFNIGAHRVASLGDVDLVSYCKIERWAASANPEMEIYHVRMCAQRGASIGPNWGEPRDGKYYLWVRENRKGH